MVTSPMRVGLLQFLPFWVSNPLYPASAQVSVSVGILGVRKVQLRLQGFTTLHLLLTHTLEQGSEQTCLFT